MRARCITPPNHTPHLHHVTLRPQSAHWGPKRTTATATADADIRSAIPSRLENNTQRYVTWQSTSRTTIVTRQFRRTWLPRKPIPRAKRIRVVRWCQLNNSGLLAMGYSQQHELTPNALLATTSTCHYHQLLHHCLLQRRRTKAFPALYPLPTAPTLGMPTQAHTSPP